MDGGFRRFVAASLSRSYFLRFESIDATMEASMTTPYFEELQIRIQGVDGPYGRRNYPVRKAI
jgi:hypothetical protein